MAKQCFALLCGLLVWLGLAVPGRGQAGTWRSLVPLPTARQELATAVLNGKVYVIGGYGFNGTSTDLVEVYNPATDTWASAHPLPAPVNHNAAAVAAGKLYSLAGTSANVYNPATDTWAAVAPMHFIHGRTPAVGVIGDKIYVAGGSDGLNSLKNLEVYNPVTNVWTVLASMSVARNHCAGAVSNGKFYVAGGRSNSFNSKNTLEVYNPLTNIWSTLPPMPTARSGIAAAAVNGEMFVFGGELPGLFAKVEAYNPATNSWRSLPDMPSARHGIWASIIGDRIYLAGGGAGENIDPSNINDVFTVDRPATFANISTRLNVQTGLNVLIGGFIVTGNTSKRVILRAPGPSVPVSGLLADPVLELHDGTGKVIAANDNWQDAPNLQEIIDSSLAPTQSAEPAILATVAPGAYTAVVHGANDSTGVGLVEVYDLEAGSDSELANISTRGLVQTDEDVMIGGIILTGSEPSSVIVRAIGPSVPVAGTLANPMLELHDANGALLASNDDWRSTQEAEIIATGLAPPNNLEAAIVRTLPSASYTAVVRGAGGTTGIALVEAYRL